MRAKGLGTTPLDEAPPFWWRKKPGALALALFPVGFLWGRVAGLRMGRPPDNSVSVPVLCVGNFVAGGAGKTPAVLAFGRAAKRKGRRPGFLSRGYGGRIVGPAIVDTEKHRAVDVGDEPLELAQVSITAISANRVAGAALLAEKGCDFIIMDDGFQNPGLAKDFSLVVVDAKRGLGNGLPIPAGPMRAPLDTQLMHADAVLVVGDAPGGDEVIRSTARRGKPVYAANIRATGSRRQWIEKRVLAYAGIADPEKLFDSLAEAGAVIVVARSFPDHHLFSDEDARELLELAQSSDLELATTTKDLLRMRGGGPMLERLADNSRAFTIKLEFEDIRTGDMIIETAVRNAEARRLREYGKYRPEG